MSVDDPGAYRSFEDQSGPDGKRAHGGRHRKGRRAAIEAVTLSEVTDLVPRTAEPLFTFESPLAETLVDLSLVEDDAALVDLLWALPPDASRPLAPAPSLDHAHDAHRSHDADQPDRKVGRRGIRRWWREESLARAARKRAYATAEAIIRAQAVQQVTQPATLATPPELRAQSMQSMLALTEERFQSLGLRSDRLADELTGISRSLDELRDLMVAGGSPSPLAGAATQALGTLEDRFGGFLRALSQELVARSLETDRRITERITLQSAELATMLESAVERIRAAIPEGLGDLKSAIREGFDDVTSALPGGFDAVRSAIPVEMARLREQQREELEGILATSQKQLELLRAFSREELQKMRSASAEELARIRSITADALGDVAASVPGELVRLREVTAGELARFREEANEQLDRVRWAIQGED